MVDKEKAKDLSCIEFAEHPPFWVKESDLAFINENQDIKDVIKFFVVNSPCPNVSARGIDLTQYGWKEKNPSKGSYLYNRLLAAAGLMENETLFVHGKADKTKELFLEAKMSENFCCEVSTNRIAIINGGNLIITIFRAIRNCLAHCRFTITAQDGVFLLAMENGVATKDRLKVKARIVLKLSTMMEWVRIIREDCVKAEENERRYATQVENMLLNIIQSGDYTNTRDMIKKLNCKKSDAEAAKKRLLTQGIIKYSQSEKKWIIIEECERGQIDKSQSIHKERN